MTTPMFSAVLTKSFVKRDTMALVLLAWRSNVTNRNTTRRSSAFTSRTVTEAPYLAR